MCLDIGTEGVSKKIHFLCPNYKQNKPIFVLINYVVSKNHLFHSEIIYKLHQFAYSRFSVTNNQ